MIKTINFKKIEWFVGYVIVFLLFLSWYGCKKEGRIDFYSSNAPAPSQIKNLRIQPVQGGAILTYKVPEDSNFLYAKAVYEIRSGVYREARSSRYKDTLNLVGYGDTLSHEVKVFSVGKNQKESEPIVKKFFPLTPPVQSVFKTLQLEATFGGVEISFKNKTQSDLAIVLIQDSTNAGFWSPLKTFYTGALEGNFSYRGLDTTLRKFAVYIRDRWNNKSDTLLKSISPLFEEEIPKNTWKVVPLQGDEEVGAEPIYKLKNLFDGVNQRYNGLWASSNSSTLPQSFTIDLGEKVVVSRIVEHQVEPKGHFYNGSAVKEFELWGSNNPNTDGSYASWDSLGTFHSFKPSGLPLGQTNDADVQYGYIQGENFAFDHILPAYRYIRWKTLETYSSSGQVIIGEIDIWGKKIH